MTTLPFDTRVEIMGRVPHMLELLIRNTDPKVSAYRVYGHRTLTDAYGDPTGSLVGGAGSVPFIPYIGRETSYRSNLIQKRRLGGLYSNADLRNMSRIFLDLDDFESIPELPSDEEILFLRVQEFAPGGFRTILAGPDAGQPLLGAITVCPPPSYYGSSRAFLTLAGIAPAATGATAGNLPPRNESGLAPPPLDFVLPFTSGMFLHNNGTSPLLYCAGWGLPMGFLENGDGPVEVPGGIKQLILAGFGGAVDFTVTLSPFQGNDI